jgi:hypothetical protein
LIVTTVPGTPEVGENEVIVGAVTVNEPGATIVCPLTTTEILTSPALSPEGTFTVRALVDEAYDETLVEPK